MFRVITYVVVIIVGIKATLPFCIYFMQTSLNSVKKKLHYRNFKIFIFWWKKVKKNINFILQRLQLRVDINCFGYISKHILTNYSKKIESWRQIESITLSKLGSYPLVGTLMVTQSTKDKWCVKLVVGI